MNVTTTTTTTTTTTPTLSSTVPSDNLHPATLPNSTTEAINDSTYNLDTVTDTMPFTQPSTLSIPNAMVNNTTAADVNVTLQEALSGDVRNEISNTTAHTSSIPLSSASSEEGTVISMTDASRENDLYQPDNVTNTDTTTHMLTHPTTSATPDSYVPGDTISNTTLNLNDTTGPSLTTMISLTSDTRQDSETDNSTNFSPDTTAESSSPDRMVQTSAVYVLNDTTTVNQDNITTISTLNTEGLTDYMTTTATLNHMSESWNNMSETRNYTSESLNNSSESVNHTSESLHHAPESEITESDMTSAYTMKNRPELPTYNSGMSGYHSESASQMTLLLVTLIIFVLPLNLR